MEYLKFASIDDARIVESEINKHYNYPINSVNAKTLLPEVEGVQKTTSWAAAEKVGDFYILPKPKLEIFESLATKELKFDIIDETYFSSSNIP